MWLKTLVRVSCDEQSCNLTQSWHAVHPMCYKKKEGQEACKTHRYKVYLMKAQLLKSTTF